ncbi:Rz1-like lysis system protein LysC [Pseudomonas luteola]|uniref:Rz1-like lysis system protein LysC n=1 Tax=Pseudomonas luteola TaxID=47886 RepID=UPI001FCBE8FE|nr:Rz1-like lysis system protein LysC [Pseudomonas luteola]
MSTLKQLGYGLALLVAVAAFLWIQHLRLETAEAAQASAESRATQAEQDSLSRQQTIDTLTHTLQGERDASGSCKPSRPTCAARSMYARPDSRNWKMKTKRLKTGLLGSCLTLLASCGSVPPSPAPQLIVSGCP